MAYTAKCTGRYIGQFTMRDPVEFNKLLNEGCTIQEAGKRMQTSTFIVGSAFFPFFSYTVNGVEYVRASYRLKEHFGRSIGSANFWMKGAQCTVWYDPENPGDAVIEDKKGKAEAKDVEPGAVKKSSLKWLWIMLGVLAAMGIVQVIMHAILFSSIAK